MAQSKRVQNMKRCTDAELAKEFAERIRKGGSKVTTFCFGDRLDSVTMGHHGEPAGVAMYFSENGKLSEIHFNTGEGD